MKKHILVTLMLACVVVGILSFLGKEADPNARNNAFNRQFLVNTIIPLHQIKMKKPLFDLCGYTPSHFFFSNSNPRKLILLDRSLISEDSLQIPMPVNSELLTGFDFVVDSPLVTLYARNMAMVLSYQMGDTLLRFVKLALPLFSRMVFLSPSSIVLRAFDSSQQIQYFQKADAHSGIITAKNQLLADSQKDKGFSTNGFLRYDTFTHRLLYIEANRNKFYCMDSNLNVIYSGKTIDTVSTNLISTWNTAKNNQQDGSLMASAPVLVVNKSGCVAHGKLFNISGLKADNEKNTSFRDSTVVDMYNIQDSGRYAGSFYLPNFQDEKAKSIYIRDSTLIALYPGGVATFLLPSNIRE